MKAIYDNDNVNLRLFEICASSILSVPFSGSDMWNKSLS